MLNSVLIPFATAPGGTVLYEDDSLGVMGGYPGTVSVLLSQNIEILARQPGQVAVPGFTGNTPIIETPTPLALAAGSTFAFTLPQAKAIVAANCGTIVSYN